MTTTLPANRVLLVSALQVYPTLSGGHLRTFSLANALASHGKEVFVYSFLGRKGDYFAGRPSDLQAWPGGIEEYVNRSRLGFLAGYGSYWFDLPPLWLTAYLHSARVSGLSFLLPRLLREKLSWCDTVIADFPFVYPILQAKEASGRLRVLNLHNVEHHLYDEDDGWRSRLLRKRVRHTEFSAVGSADVVVGCSGHDREYFEAHASIRRSLLVPNGIDPDRFRFPPELGASMRAELQVPESVRLFLFTASKWGPNQEAFDYLLSFARTNERELVGRGIHILVVGGVVEAPIKLPALTATGRVDAVEPYFAAADAALNPITTGAGTNVKMGEFIAARLPVLVSTFGTRGYSVEHGKSGFVFERGDLLDSLVEVRRLFDADPAALERIVDRALADNAQFIDMSRCVEPLVEVMNGG